MTSRGDRRLERGPSALSQLRRPPVAVTPRARTRLAAVGRRPGLGVTAAVLGLALTAGCTGPDAAATEVRAAGTGTSATPTATAGATAYRVVNESERGRIGSDATYTATVPRLVGPDATIVDRVNSAIADYLREQRAGTSHATLTLRVGVPHVGSQVLALSFGGDRYPPGAAHPSELASGLVFDLRDGHRIGIEDVFTSTATGLRRLESVVRPELDRRFPGGPTGGVTDPVPANYREFVVNPRGLVVIVADLPYVIGPQSVLVPWERLTDLVRPDLAAMLRS